VNAPVLDASVLAGAELSTLDAIAAVEAGLAALGRGTAQQPHPGTLSPGGAAFLQPLAAALPELDAACLNWLTFHPANSARGRPHSGGVLILNTFSTGEVLCIMDGLWVSHRRTGYVAGLGAKYLAGPVGDIALIGPGAIAPFALDALAALGLAGGEIRVCGRRDESTRAFCAAMTERLGVQAVPHRDPRAAIAGARLVITSTSHHGPPFLEPDWLSAGTLVVMIDRLRLITPALLARADRIVTNSRESLARWGVADEPRVESFPAIVAAGRAAPVSAREIVLYDAGGLAVADLAYAVALWRRHVAAHRNAPLRSGQNSV
jgi:ornithine cyclodeaminase